MEENVVKIENLIKIYPMFDNKIDRLKEALSLTRKKYHSEFYALKNVNFQIKKGETLGIIGKNGSGKSTLLKIISGVLTQTSGEVMVNGKISALLELGAGFNPEITGLENIYLNGTIMGYTKEEMDKKVPSIVEFADIGEFINHPVKMYSSGMFVRLAFAVSINVEPDILIVDEALSVGDAFFQLKCYRKFEEFKEKGKTIIFVTHDMGSIIKFCDRAILFADGNLVADGTPRIVVDKYKKLIVGMEINEEDKTIDIETLIDQKLKYGESWKEHLEINPSMIDYGNRKAQIIDYAVMDNLGHITTNLAKGEECLFKMKVRFNENISSPIYAIAIKDIKGSEITGTNTMLEKIDTGFPKRGDVIEVNFMQKINLQGGPYFLSFGCTHLDKNGELEVFHRLYDLVSLDIIQAKVSTGIFDMNTRIAIK